MASDSSFAHAVGFDGMLEVIDEGGWSREVLPLDDVVFGGGGTGVEDNAAAHESWLETLGPLDSISTAVVDVKVSVALNDAAPADAASAASFAATASSAGGLANIAAAVAAAESPGLAGGGDARS